MAKSQEQPPSWADTKKHKKVTYVVRQRGDAWHWEARENGNLIDSGDANSIVDARVAALLVATKRN